MLAEGYGSTMTIATTPFGPMTTALEVAAGIDLSGTRAVVTGAASGLGLETARAIASTGAGVTLAVRDIAAGQRAADEIMATTGNVNISVNQLDLGDWGSIDAFVDRWGGPLHVLVNNAGIMATPEARTDRGHELQFAVNHLGHFRLVTGLHGALASAGGARVVVVSSIAHRRSPVMFDDIHFADRDYDKWSAYGQSKTANVLSAVGVADRWAADGITANAVHPGGIMTNLQRHMDPEEFKVLGWMDADGNLREGFKTPEQGAATSTVLAVSPHVAGVTGTYFEDCNEALEATAGDRSHGVESYALDPGLADRLWDESVRMLAG